jgi:uncharacterized membrane protein
MKLKTALRWLLTLFVGGAGVGHFVVSADFIRMVPAWLPAPALLVYVSGVCEIAGAVGLQSPRLRRWAAYGLIALFIAVFPANVNMAVHHLSPGRFHAEPWQLWARLPLQALLIAWAWWVRE